MLIVVALWIFWGFGYETLWKRLTTNVEGTVVSAKDIPVAPGRHGTEYILRSPDGGTIVYVAGPSDASLPRSMPVGTYIKKRLWHLSYERDGHQAQDFSVLFYATILAIAAGCLAWGVRLNRNQPE